VLSTKHVSNAVVRRFKYSRTAALPVSTSNAATAPYFRDLVSFGIGVFSQLLCFFGSGGGIGREDLVLFDQEFVLLS
jgi:hypothetical protein